MHLPGQVLLEYLVGEEGSFLFLLGGDEYRLLTLPVGG